MKVVGCVLDYLHGNNELKMFTNGKTTQMAKQLHMFEQPQNLFTNVMLKFL
jgi:hypothetical protein